MGRRGRKRNLNLEDEYWKLILAGVGPIAAARHVGIGRTTGHRWRSQRGGVAPLRMNEVVRHERYLSLLERKRRKRPDVRTPRFIAPATLIDHRPAVVEEGSRAGDWEGDLIIGSRTQSAIGTLVDRKYGYVLLLHLPTGHSSAEVTRALAHTMESLPSNL